MESRVRGYNEDNGDPVQQTLRERMTRRVEMGRPACAEPSQHEPALRNRALISASASSPPVVPSPGDGREWLAIVFSLGNVPHGHVSLQSGSGLIHLAAACQGQRQQQSETQGDGSLLHDASESSRCYISSVRPYSPRATHAVSRQSASLGMTIGCQRQTTERADAVSR